MHTKIVPLFLSIWVFFYEHSSFTGQEGRRNVISLVLSTTSIRFTGNLGFSRAITAGSSTLHIASSWTRTGNLWFPSSSLQPLNYAPTKLHFFERGRIFTIFIANNTRVVWTRRWCWNDMYPQSEHGLTHQLLKSNLSIKWFQI